MFIGSELVKRVRLLHGRSESIRTRFELDDAGKLVEHVVVETHDRPAAGTSGDTSGSLQVLPRLIRGDTEG